MASHRKIAYYITSHGYGHGVRSCGVIRTLNELYPDLPVQIVSSLPEKFLTNQTGSTANPIRARSFDIGMVQLDSIRVDVERTLEKIEGICDRRAELVRQEMAFIAQNGISLVAADIPGIPLEAAALSGIPSVAVGNFGWDWIYSEFAARNTRWMPAVDMFREQYGKATLLLRLPFCEEMKAFPEIEDIPLVARPGNPCRRKIADLAGCDEGKPWILLSFTTLDWTDETLSRVESLQEYEFLTVLPLQWQRKNIHALSREQITFSDVIASCDAVLSKPGFGILSDCIVNRKPLIYADRSNFLEYPILESAIRKYLKHVHIPAAKLYAGEIRESIESLWSAPEPKGNLPAGGDRIAAMRLYELC